MQDRHTDAWRTAALLRTCLLLLLLSGMAVAQGRNSVSWPLAGHDLNGSRSQPSETQIKSSNVGTLTPRWVFTTGGDVSATPTVSSDGAIYFPDWAGNLFAVDAKTGQQIWANRIDTYDPGPSRISRISPAIYNGAIIVGDNVSQGIEHNGANIFSVNRSNGQLNWITQVEAHPAAIITGSPIVSGNTIYVGVSSNEEALATNPAYPCCTFRGSMVALNADTGAVLWKTYDMPDNGGQPGAYSGGAIWGPPVLHGGTLFTATGNNYDVPADVKTCAAANPTQDCTAPNDFFNTAMALNPADGSIKWAHKLATYDAWTVACVSADKTNCPSPNGPDFDFGDGPNYISGPNLVGFGQKSGIYWALNPSNGNIVWSTIVGPGSTLGGMEWGSATDGTTVYVQDTNNDHVSFQLANGGPTISWGSWAALDGATGRIIWQVGDPHQSTTQGAVSFADGVLYAGDIAGSMIALDATNGAVRLDFNSGGSVIDGPSIVNGFVYWGSGYAHLSPGIANNKVYAFHLP